MKKLITSLTFGNHFRKITSFLGVVKDFCIKYAGRIVLLSMFLCMLIQPVFKGSDLLVNLAVFVIFAISVALMTLRRDEQNDVKIGKWIIGIGVLCSLFLSVLWTHTADYEKYFFRDGKQGSEISLNTSFRKIHTQELPKEISFILVTTEGGYTLKHQCTAQIDISTWKQYDLDKEKLLVFIRKDAMKRLMSSFSECRLQETAQLHKYYMYRNGICINAELQPIAQMARTTH